MCAKLAGANAVEFHQLCRKFCSSYSIALPFFRLFSADYLFTIITDETKQIPDTTNIQPLTANYLQCDEIFRFRQGSAGSVFFEDCQTQTNLAVPVVLGQPDCFGRGRGGKI
jgi:hypothetical protein